MVRYMRKAKSGEVAVMDVIGSQQSTIGVRTRARALALQRVQSTGGDSSTYLELRSRRLEKPLFLLKPKEALKESGPDPSPISKSGQAGPNPNPKEAAADEIEVSFVVNVLEFEARNTGETTPCGLMRDSETIGTPGSTTRRRNSNGSSRIMQNSMLRNIPTSHEMEEFFACAERVQHQIFIEKYNFDPVNDSPLPGRYEWAKVEYV